MTGRVVERTTVSDDEYRASLRARGVPAGGAMMVLSIFAASRAGEFAVIDPTLQQLVGRKPRTVCELLASAGRA